MIIDKKTGSFVSDTEIKNMCNAERRILKQLEVIYFTGLVIDEIFKFDFPVLEDITFIFRSIAKQIDEKVINIENILSEIRDYVSINQASFPTVVKDINQKNTIAGLISHQKVYGYLFSNQDSGCDLGIIKSHFLEWMNEKWKSKTGGLYVLSILKEKGIVLNRCQKRIDDKRVDLVYIKNLFEAERIDNRGVKDANPFG